MKTIKILTLLLLISLAGMAMHSCGDDERFRVEGVVDGLGTRGLLFVYETDGGGVQTVMAQAIDGKFSIVGSSKEYTLGQLLTADSRVVARVVVRNGQTLKCVFDLENPYNVQIKGNSVCEDWAKFLRENEQGLRNDSHAEANALIRNYISDHKDDMASTALLLTQYYAVGDESVVDSLMSVIDPSARPESLVAGYRRMVARLNSAAIEGKMTSFSLYRADGSIENYFPGRTSYTLVYFSGRGNERRDTIKPILHRLIDSLSMRQIKVMEVSLVPDTTIWMNHYRADSARWAMLWSPGGPANPSFISLDIPRTPYWVVTDSTGAQVYRGTTLSTAVDTLRRRLHRPTL